MPDMSEPISPAAMAVYRATHRRRQARRAAELAAWRAHLQALADRAAALLKADFGVAEVWLFGSLARDRAIDERSDIDLAVRDLPSDRYLRAVSRLLDLDGRVELDLVRLEEAPPSLAAEIVAEGRRL
jgi:predicted nucleotidyltransferase